MNDVELAGLVARLKYKPGWEFQYHPSGRYVPSEVGWAGGDEDRVIVTAVLEDSNGTRNRTQVAGVAILRPDMDLHAVLYAIHFAILQLEQHEILEWFKLNGVQAFDPHPTGLGSFATRPQHPDVPRASVGARPWDTFA